MRLRFEKDGTLGRIASHIQTEKTLNFLFEHARKVRAEAENGSRPVCHPTWESIVNDRHSGDNSNETIGSFQPRRAPGAEFSRSSGGDAGENA